MEKQLKQKLIDEAVEMIISLSELKNELLAVFKRSESVIFEQTHKTFYGPVEDARQFL